MIVGCHEEAKKGRGEEMPKPAVFDFFLRGWPLEEALAIFERWDALTVPERTLAARRWDRLTAPERLRLNLCFEIEPACLPAPHRRH
jgi:hypothetical protein